MVNGILWKVSTVADWRDLPERYGPWKTVYERFRRWSADGIRYRLPAHAPQHCDATGTVEGPSCASAPRPCGPISMRPRPEKGGQERPGEATGPAADRPRSLAAITEAAGASTQLAQAVNNWHHMAGHLF